MGGSWVTHDLKNSTATVVSRTTSRAYNYEFLNGCFVPLRNTDNANHRCNSQAHHTFSDLCEISGSLPEYHVMEISKQSSPF